MMYQNSSFEVKRMGKEGLLAENAKIKIALINNVVDLQYVALWIFFPPIGRDCVSPLSSGKWRRKNK